MEISNFDKYPAINVDGYEGWSGWSSVMTALEQQAIAAGKKRTVIAVECYHGVQLTEVVTQIRKGLPTARIFETSSALLPEQTINEMVYPYVTDDPVFGYISPLKLEQFFDAKLLTGMEQEVEAVAEGLVVVIGIGATLAVPKPDMLVYADMPRWEIQLRFRRNEVGNLGVTNFSDSFAYKYKRSFFVDWRVCDRHKVELMERWDFALDTVIAGEPKMVRGAALLAAFKQAVHQPFRVVPYFDPGPWGGQWLKKVIGLDPNQVNFAWGFDCVPEENSLLLKFGDMIFETPSINLVFNQPQQLLGKKVYEAFGAEFPIRFDFLDTMEGGNLSLQVHPLKEYIREKFGMAYTQDESYYFLEAKDDAFVYLGLKDNVVPEKMIDALKDAQDNGSDFDAEAYVQKWPIKKHDHVLIPSGTVHCSGSNSVVLEISATPYIFTFKLWDWGRMGLDGKPRPISLEHGKNVIQWNRTTEWTREHILDKTELITEGDGWKEERTGLDEFSFIETRRHWFTKKVTHHTEGRFNVLNLIEGREAIVESPSNAFKPFIVHYAETFIVPADAGEYTIRPYGKSEGQQCATIKAYVRTEHLIDHRIN
ncbi:class I mannose-6-phosphate isomerase [Pseudobacter ginsenosidimutans]|uniref:Mannose-6-phosphate isomerase class I n=1 Tax=Pseudobacter ginsenosidimutans TaxID=661488 RepID=A0A4Q7N1C8_9BACT|nr:class I mannose-6-phosphate isomerase [Pseudobacter ginsenosidimutans]QEC43974.1 mannose-6-phosphate isomerase [Pseudobacter ginsenosidimutans]RZS75410.1 mannose-6-phosphate isomerase class I [Pseudobacter ginsenosidimutans]